MPGPPVTIGAVVTLTPGAAGPPDAGTSIAAPRVFATAHGLRGARGPPPPAAAGPPAAGTIIAVPMVFATANGMPLATAGSTCQMINSLTGIPYPIVIPPLGASTGVMIGGMPVVRLGDRIVMGPALPLVAGAPDGK